ncbi:hypothetical protein PHISCL_10954, partial [Aspergillus sclerotialis]
KHEPTNPFRPVRWPGSEAERSKIEGFPIQYSPGYAERAHEVLQGNHSCESEPGRRSCSGCGGGQAARRSCETTHTATAAAAAETEDVERGRSRTPSHIADPGTHT